MNAYKAIHTHHHFHHHLRCCQVFSDPNAITSIIIIILSSSTLSLSSSLLQHTGRIISSNFNGTHTYRKYEYAEFSSSSSPISCSHQFACKIFPFFCLLFEKVSLHFVHCLGSLYFSSNILKKQMLSLLGCR